MLKHVQDGNGDKACFLWEGNDVGVQSSTTYKQLQDKVCQVSSRGAAGRRGGRGAGRGRVQCRARACLSAG